MCIRLRSDNIGTLHIMSNMQTSSKIITAVAREVAFDISMALCAPIILEHIPGVANVSADYLSRIKDPAKKLRKPKFLDNGNIVQLPARSVTWWKTVQLPTATDEAHQAGDCGLPSERT